MYTVTAETEIWGDDREPGVSVSHRLLCATVQEVMTTVRDLLNGLSPNYRLVIVKNLGPDPQEKETAI